MSCLENSKRGNDRKKDHLFASPGEGLSGGIILGPKKQTALSAFANYTGVGQEKKRDGRPE